MELAEKLATAVVLLTLLVSPPLSAQKLKTSPAYKFGPFNDTIYYNTIFAVEAPATISNDALQVTPDSASNALNLTYQYGRVFYRRPFKLWDGGEGAAASSHSGRVASFNSSFLVNLYRLDNSTAGEGLTFVVAPDLNLPPNSYGQYLGLTNSTTDGNSTNRFIAVELDTFKEDFDPDDNHIGLNINSVRSNTTTSLTPLGIELIPGPVGNASFFNVWVQYDGIAKTIEVYIAQQDTQLGSTPPMPATPVLKSDLDLRSVVDQVSYFGFSASTSNATQLNCVLRWNLTVEYFAEDKFPWLTISVAAAVSTVVVVIVAMGFVYYIRKKRNSMSSSNILGALKRLPGALTEFSFKDLKKATNNFDEKNKLGHGGFGVVYRGYLQNEKLEMAVKWFTRGSIKGQDDFLAELTIINRLRHKHLVRLLGKSLSFCFFIFIRSVTILQFFPIPNFHK
ncbi:hypothetical protein U1Q18_039921 [Sarracenia purpurea var. burkii]